MFCSLDPSTTPSPKSTRLLDKASRLYTILSTTQSDSMLKAHLDLQLAELRLRIYDKHQANQLNAQIEKGS